MDGLEFLRLLSFAEMEVREQTVADAYNDTYEWMLRSDEYLAWKSSPGQRLLINGKAGCGKSTLMKHLFTHETLAAAGPSTTKPVVCGFFFNGRGGPMEKTLMGMLRRVLHQIVFQSPTAYKCLAPFYHHMNKVNTSRDRRVDWTGETLTRMFETVMQSSTKQTLIFIDALDEGEGFSLAQVFRLLEKHTNPRPDSPHATASVCLSSRPGNFVNHRNEWTTINLTDFNSVDIETYTASRLHTMAKDCADSRYEQLAAELAPQILGRADGVFLWARLVVDEIAAAMESYESVEYIRSQLSATPTDLWEHFRGILSKVKDHHIPDMKRLLQVILAAERPLSMEELVHVMALSSADPPRTLSGVWEVEAAEQRCQDMRRHMMLCCGGLVEVVETRRFFYVGKFKKLRYGLTTRVQFIHQSVKDYLGSARIPKELAAMLGSTGLEGNGHRLLLTACLRYMQLPEMAAMTDRGAPSPYRRRGVDDPNSELQAFWTEISDQRPFLLYSPFWLRHADKSIDANDSEMGGNQEGLKIMEAIFRAWRFFPYPCSQEKEYGLYNHIYKNMAGASVETCASLLNFSAYQGFARLFEKVLYVSHQEVSQHNLDQALIAACDCGLQGELRRDPESEDRLSEAAWQAKEVIVRVLLDGGANPSRKLRIGCFGSALTAACWGGRLSIVQMLLACDAKVNAKIPEGWYSTALSASVGGSSIPVTRLLIDRGADVNAQLKKGNIGSALAQAATRGDIGMVQALIDSGANVDLLLQNGSFGSALATAAYWGNVAITTLLVRHGANVNMQIPDQYGSALAAACASYNGGSVRVIEILLEAGAKVDLLLESGCCGSALATAARESRNRTKVDLLLQHGADPNLELACGHFGTALIAAATACFGSYTPWDGESLETSTFSALVEHGAKIDAHPRIGFYGSALVAAASYSQLDLVDYLVRHGAKVNTVLDVGRYGSALAGAASCYKCNFHTAEPVVLFLLEHGADVSAVLPVGTCGSALGAVLAKGSNGSSKMYRLLLKYGAKLSGNERPPSGDGGQAFIHEQDSGHDDETAKEDR